MTYNRGAMGLWYKVTLPSVDVAVGGEGTRLQSAFEEIFIAHRTPMDAALFGRRSPESQQHYFYFSPSAALIATSLIQRYAGVVCEAPPQDDRTHQLVG